MRAGIGVRFSSRRMAFRAGGGDLGNCRPSTLVGDPKRNKCGTAWRNEELNGLLVSIPSHGLDRCYEDLISVQMRSRRRWASGVSGCGHSPRQKCPLAGRAWDCCGSPRATRLLQRHLRCDPGVVGRCRRDFRTLQIVEEFMREFRTLTQCSHDESFRTKPLMWFKHSCVHLGTYAKISQFGEGVRPEPQSAVRIACS